MYKDGMPETIYGDEYVLHMNTETARIVSRACELYARLRCGQFEELQHLTVWPTEKDDETFSSRIEMCRIHLDCAKMAAFPELNSPGSSYGVGKFRDSDAAWNVYQAVRYVMAWREHPEGGVTIDFQKPLQYSAAPMPRCEVLDGGDPFTNPRIENNTEVKDVQ